jgi:hypothetical protein
MEDFAIESNIETTKKEAAKVAQDELKSRKIKLSIDDRKYIPVLNFDSNKKQITLEVKNAST